MPVRNRERTTSRQTSRWYRDRPQTPHSSASEEREEHLDSEERDEENSNDLRE